MNTDVMNHICIMHAEKQKISETSLSSMFYVNRWPTNDIIEFRWDSIFAHGCDIIYAMKFIRGCIK